MSTLSFNHRPLHFTEDACFPKNYTMVMWGLVFALNYNLQFIDHLECEREYILSLRFICSSNLKLYCGTKASLMPIICGNFIYFTVIS